MGVVLGAWQFVYLLTAVPAGAVLDRFGTTRAIAVGGALVALSGFGRAAADGLGGLLVAVGLFGVGGPLISIGAPKLVRSHFDDRSRGPAMGVVAAAPGVGATLALVTANSVLMARTGSWRATMATFAGVAALACLLWLAASWWADTSPRRRARAVPASDDAGRGDRGRDLPSSRRSDRNHDELAAADTAEEEDGRDRDGPVAAALALLRVRRVRRLLAAVAGTFFVVHAMSNWVVEMLRSFGAGAELASLGAAVLSLVGVVAALTLPSLTAPERRAVVLVVLLVLGAVGLVALAVGPGPPRLAGLVLVGVMRGATVAVLTLLVMSAPGVGDRNMGIAGGLIFTAGEIGGVAGPVVTGVVADVADGFVTALIVLVAVCSATAYLGWLEVRDQPRDPENQKPPDFHAA